MAFDLSECWVDDADALAWKLVAAGADVLLPEDTE